MTKEPNSSGITTSVIDHLLLNFCDHNPHPPKKMFCQLFVAEPTYGAQQPLRLSFTPEVSLQ